MNKYKQLQRKVYERDRGICRICGTHTNAPPHHIIFKSHCGIDDERNMVMLCPKCHRKAHSHDKYYREMLLNSQYEIYGRFDNRVIKKQDRYKNFKYSR